ncbi:sigma-70 family RNA polymerase sigma factor [Amycolatopsis sp.]|uniref:RNA polymerase sigma factor n=1 Tax=Amycolatopsis sp. TaxID=37632 RepID=UPI002DFCE204|nr:sigma-70 family RNA polymerase sigma factor [Amycolatopsis sp.]
MALGLLLARHRPGMRAVALSLLGHGHDADDAVQDASLVALLRIGDVRDPAAVGPWLRMIVRNACRTRPRTRCWRTARCATGLAEALRDSGTRHPDPRRRAGDPGAQRPLRPPGRTRHLHPSRQRLRSGPL